jgi:hypothetical protein
MNLDEIRARWKGCEAVQSWGDGQPVSDVQDLLALIDAMQPVVDAAKRVAEAHELKDAVPGYITPEDLSEPLEDLQVAVDAFEAREDGDAEA